MGSVLSVERLTKVYKMGEVEVPALRGIDLALRAGDLVVLLGASGSGKSTLLNIMGGLDLPSAGRVHYGEQDLTTASERALTLYRRDPHRQRSWALGRLPTRGTRNRAGYTVGDTMIGRLSSPSTRHGRRAENTQRLHHRRRLANGLPKNLRLAASLDRRSPADSRDDSAAARWPAAC
jgi:ABC-type glutathione transport system ATPase component